MRHTHTHTECVVAQSSNIVRHSRATTERREEKDAIRELAIRIRVMNSA